MTAFKPLQGQVGNCSIQKVRRMICKRYPDGERIGIVMEGIRGDESGSVVYRRY